MKSKGGFTLIELVVVITILGILLGITVPGVMNYMSDAKAKECAVNRKAILLDLDAKRVLDPGASLADVIEAVSDSIHCPEEAVYIADGNRVKCPIHGEDSTFSDEVENLGEVGAIDTEVVEEPEDKIEPTLPPEPSEPESTEPTEPEESETPSRPDVPIKDDVLVDGILKRQGLHPGENVSGQIKKGNLYLVEELDGSTTLCVGKNPSHWDGYDSDTLPRWDLVIVDLEYIYESSDCLEFESGQNYVLTKKIPTGSVVSLGDTWYVLINGDIWVGQKFNFQNTNDWTELTLR